MRADARQSIDLGLAVLSATLRPGETRNPYEIAEVCECSYTAIQKIERSALNKLKKRPEMLELFLEATQV